MAHSITITAGAVEVSAELNDTDAAEAVWNALPISASGSTWGDEIYFRIPVAAEPEDLQEVVDFGDLAYWPPGSAFCIFFGPTPASRGDEIRPASARRRHRTHRRRRGAIAAGVRWYDGNRHTGISGNSQVI